MIPDDYPPVISDTPALLRLKNAPGIEVSIMTTRPDDEVELARRISGAHSVLTIRSTTRFTHDVMASSSGLKHIAIWGTGTDNVDLVSARHLGISVTTTPNTATEAVAEHALALLMALARRVPELDARVRAGEWPRGLLTQLFGKTIGIVGTGRIGARMAQLARGIGMDVIAWTPHPHERMAGEFGFRYVPLETLLTEADAVSLHVRLSPETRGIIGGAELAIMKPEALLVNTSRGALIDEHALADALKNDAIAGAALDVFCEEPLSAVSPLRLLPNVILSPHTAGTTAEALRNGLELAVDNLLGFLDGRVENAVVH